VWEDLLFVGKPILGFVAMAGLLFAWFLFLSSGAEYVYSEAEPQELATPCGQALKERWSQLWKWDPLDSSAAPS
jgi:hypothetical protein